MPYTPFTVERFAGLDLFNDPQEAGAQSAVDVSNVDIDRRGRVRSRDGSTAVSAAAAANPTTQMAYYKDASSIEWIVGHDSGVLRPIKISDGSAGTTQAATVTSNNSFARFGDPSNTRLYAAASGTLYRFNGAAWASVGGLPINPTLCAVTANDNRLVISDGVTIHWSDAGAPETFGANNKIQLWPGDGDLITALVRWRDYLFAFKQTKFAVFTGTGTKTDGSPEFNYRSVDIGHGAYAPGLAVAGEEGVYFADGLNVYVTDGNLPRYVSRPLELWLRQGVGLSGTSLPTFALANSNLVYHNRRLYGLYPNGSSSAAIVYDAKQDQWLVSQMGALCGASVPTSWGPYFGEHTSKKIARMDASATTDLGSAFSWYYQSGYFTPAGDKRSKLRGSSVWGTGTVTLQMLALGARSADVADPGGAITLGVSPAVAEGKRRRSCRGVLFAHKLSGTGPATVSRITHRFLPPGLDS